MLGLAYDTDEEANQKEGAHKAGRSPAPAAAPAAVDGAQQAAFAKGDRWAAAAAAVELQLRALGCPAPVGIRAGKYTPGP